ncbi:unnamed protein product [Adineta steineri]|uniref:Solute carrier family 66 member 2 n=1 Tax=Adineta steineri TaxID=433720 RepID=A0A814HCU4_9BILA|nr:unnamed protein product [Adineta steineri]CAF3696705.1 unnamed protein product [Adineta steineri]
MRTFIDSLPMADISELFASTVRVFSQALMIFGGVVPYIPQYMIINRSQNAEGFSNYVCLTLLIANILRIEFWFGKHFETPLLVQSIIMILCMLVMLELCIRVHSKAIRHHLPISQQNLSTSKELTIDHNEKRFTDLDTAYFWRWTTFTSYIQFLCLFTILLSSTTWLFLDKMLYIETIGFLAVFFEALLGTPQFLRNFRLKSTEGMSVKMVLMWTSGDIFKTVYFLLRNAPKQFWLCGLLQISIDIAILCQVLIYSDRYKLRIR